jgi:hypothetical protein
MGRNGPMSSREQQATINVRRAIKAASSEFELKRLDRTGEGYSATFQRGMVTHVESGIDEAAVEDVPPTAALMALIRKVESIFAEMS